MQHPGANNPCDQVTTRCHHVVVSPQTFGGKAVVLIGLAVVATSCGVVSSLGGGGSEPAEWIVRVDPPDLHARVLPLLVLEQACASGARADGRVAVEVEESSEEVRITVAVRRLTGVQDCPGNPLTPVSVTLEEPVGDRRLIDGASGFAPSLHGFIDQPADPILTGRIVAPAVIPASERMVADGFWVEPRCELEGSLEESYLPEWRPQEEFGDAGSVLSAAVAEMRLSVHGWHGYGEVDAVGREVWSWVQYLGGRPVAVVIAEPAVLGTSGMALVCGDLPTGWVPDPAPPPTKPAGPSMAARLDLDAILADAEGLTRVGDEWMFDDPDHRCDAWVALEDRLEAAGYVIAQTVEHGELPTDELSDQTVTRQVSALITDAGGRAAVVTTTGVNTLVTRDATVTGAVETPNEWSYLAPCQLDRSMEVDLPG